MMMIIMVMMIMMMMRRPEAKKGFPAQFPPWVQQQIVNIGMNRQFDDKNDDHNQGQDKNDDHNQGHDKNGDQYWQKYKPGQSHHWHKSPCDQDFVERQN